MIAHFQISPSGDRIESPADVVVHSVAVSEWTGIRVTRLSERQMVPSDRACEVVSNGR